SGTYVDAGHGAGTGGGLLNLSLLNGIGGSNILSPSIGGPSVGLGAIFDQDVAGNGGKSLLGSLFGQGGNTGDSTNTVSGGGDAGDVTAGSGAAAVADGGIGGLINAALGNGIGGSDLLSTRVSAPPVSVAATVDR